MSYALSVTQTLNWLIRTYSEIETNIISVERVDEYMNLPSERQSGEDEEDVILSGNGGGGGGAGAHERRPSLQWPSNGVVKFVDYATRYRDELDLVLDVRHVNIWSS